jgi:hypothetical protein
VREALDSSAADPLVLQSELTSQIATAVANVDTTDTDVPIFTPEAPQNLVAVAGFEFITITWDTPAYFGHEATEVWRSVDSDFGNAILIATLSGYVSVFSDYIGTNAEFNYWIRFRNLADVYGPYAGPVSAQTAYNVTELLNELTDEISQSQLAEDLNNLTNGVKENYMVTVDANGLANGFGLASVTSDTGDTTTEFGVLVNRFFLMSPPNYNQPGQPTGVEGHIWRNSGTGEYKLYTDGVWGAFDGIPFIIQTTPTMIGDVEVPPGVYIKSAFIQDASITNAKIGEAAIDFANIVDASITTGKIANLDAAVIRTGEIASYNFSNNANSSGFFLNLGQTENIDEDGNVTYTSTQPQLIIRSFGSATPALELRNGSVTINAALIRETLQSVGYGVGTPGFQFDVNDGSFIIRGPGGTILLASDSGYDGTLVQSSIQATLDAMNQATGDSQFAANAAQAEAEAAGQVAGVAQNTADVAGQAAQAAQAELDLTFEDDGSGGYKFTDASYTNFFGFDNQLKGFAFLDKITPANFTTYLANAAIGQAAIGNLAVGTAQMEDLAVTTAKIAVLAVKEANIDALAVTTLKIGDNAVTVPVGVGGWLGYNSTGAWNNIGSVVDMGGWAITTGPTHAILQGRVQFGGGPVWGGNADEGGAEIYIQVDFQSNLGTWISYASSASLSLAAFSFADGYGGVVNTSMFVAVPTWCINARAQLKARTQPPPNQTTAHERYMSNYSISALAAKK